MLVAEEQMAKAITLCAALDGSYQKYSHWIVNRLRKEYAAAQPIARQALDEESFDQAWKEGQALTLWQALRVACQEED